MDFGRFFFFHLLTFIVISAELYRLFISVDEARNHPFLLFDVWKIRKIMFLFFILSARYPPDSF